MLKKNLKRTLLASLSVTLLSSLVNSGVAVFAEETVDSTQEASLSSESMYISENVALTYTDDNELLVHGTVQESGAVEITLLNTEMVFNENFELIIPILNEDIGVTVKDGNNEIVETTSFVPEQFVNELGIEVQTEELLNNEAVDSVMGSLDSDENIEYSRISEVEELLKGENIEKETQYVSPSSVQTLAIQETRQHENGIYYVQKGNNDSFTTIADSFGISVMQLKVWNPQVVNINLIVVGEQLAVTPKGFESMLSEESKKRMHTEDSASQFSNVYDFINQMAPLAQKVSSQLAEEALYPSLMIAQAIHESGVARTIGESQLARAPYYNLSGIKARGETPSVLMWTWESLPDNYAEVEDKDRINVRIMAHFQKFASYDESLQRYANLLRFGRGTGEDYYYSGTWQNNSRDVWGVLADGGLRGYATDPAYFSAIRRTITRYNLTRFDGNDRLNGENRFDTAVTISQKGWQTSDNVIIANGFKYADALAGAPLASLKNAPILLSRQNGLDANTLDEIKRLGATKATILGGETAVSNQVEDLLKQVKDKEGNQIITVERLGGDDRYQTAALIANEVKAERIENNLGLPSEGILVSGEDFADAMSIAPYAAKQGLPIYLTKSNSLPSTTETGVKQLANWTIVGGPSAVSTAVSEKLADLNRNTKRIYGDDRFETNREVIRNYSPEKESSKPNAVYVATGLDFADALTGSVLAGKENTAIILGRENSKVIDSQVSFAGEQKIKYATLIGGENSLSQKVEEAFKTLDK